MATRNTSGSNTSGTKKATKKTSGKKPSSDHGASDERGEGSDRGSAPRASAPKRASASRVAAEASRQLLELTGRDAEGVTALERTDDGWTVKVEVVELRRIPDTTDVLALYEVEADEHGDMLGYRRLRRYVRGVPGED